MKLQNLTIIFIIIILPIVLVLSAYIGYEVKTINKQNMYNTGVNTAVHDAVFAYEMNSKNDAYSNNAENKRSNIKASVKTFENSLSNACNLGLYNNDAIEEYIPAMLFGMYDGFYMYSPSNTENGYKHNLRNYVYYSEQINKNDYYDIVIRYTLDNYVAVTGIIGGKYITKAGYLINLEKCNDADYDYELKSVESQLGEATLGEAFAYNDGIIKKEETLSYISLDDNQQLLSTSHKEETARQYYKEAIPFSMWFKTYVSNKVNKDELKIGNDNDPENPNSKFTQHKQEIIKNKIENTLNSSITAYANKTRNNYKMPKFNEDEWEKIYNNISVIALVQGMNLGFKTYNSYCIINSTNNSEYVNPNLLYFTDGNSYHDIRCEEINNNNDTIGYKMGSFEKIKYDKTNTENQTTETKYYYQHNELGCYKCINGSEKSEKNIYNYMETADRNKKSSYYTSLARERYATPKLLNSTNDVDVQYVTVTYKYGAKIMTKTVKKGTSIQLKSASDIKKDDLEVPTNKTFAGWIDENKNEYAAGANITVIKDLVLEPNFISNKYTITYKINGNTVGIYEGSIGETIYLWSKDKAGLQIETYMKFNGWKDQYGATYGVDIPYNINKNLILVPIVTDTRYKVTYKKINGSDYGIDHVMKENAGNYKTKDFPEISIEEGKKLVWKDRNGNEYDENSTIDGLNGDIVLQLTKKNKEYEVVFIDGNNERTEKVNYGEKVNEPYNFRNENGYYNVYGWKDQNGDWYNFEEKVTRNMTLTIQREEFKDQLYVIKNDTQIDWNTGSHATRNDFIGSDFNTSLESANIKINSEIIDNVNKITIDGQEVQKQQEIVIDNNEKQEKTVAVEIELKFNNYINVKKLNIIFSYKKPYATGVSINGQIITVSGSFDYVSMTMSNGMFFQALGRTFNLNMIGKGTKTLRVTYRNGLTSEYTFTIYKRLFKDEYYTSGLTQTK